MGWIEGTVGNVGPVSICCNEGPGAVGVADLRRWTRMSPGKGPDEWDRSLLLGGR